MFQGRPKGVYLTAKFEHVTEYGIGLVIGGVFGRIRPFLDGFADDATLVAAGGGAIDFLEENEAPHEGRGIARGVADCIQHTGWSVCPNSRMWISAS